MRLFRLAERNPVKFISILVGMCLGGIGAVITASETYRRTGWEAACIVIFIQMVIVLIIYNTYMNKDKPVRMTKKEYDYTLVDIVDDSNYGIVDPMQKLREKALHKELKKIRIDIDTGDME